MSDFDSGAATRLSRLVCLREVIREKLDKPVKMSYDKEKKIARFAVEYEPEVVVFFDAAFESVDSMLSEDLGEMIATILNQTYEAQKQIEADDA